MDESLSWTIIFYREENGHYPVEEFLDRLSPNDKMRIRESINKLIAQNIDAREPLVKPLGEKLWELRTSGGNKIRLIYFMGADRRIVLLHGFHKKTKKIPACELNKAKKRYKAYITRA